MDAHDTAQVNGMPGPKRFVHYDCFQTGQWMTLLRKTIGQLQRFHALLKRVNFANIIAAKGKASPRINCTMRSEPSWL